MALKKNKREEKKWRDKAKCKEGWKKKVDNEEKKIRKKRFEGKWR